MINIWALPDLQAIYSQPDNHLFLGIILLAFILWRLDGHS